MAVLRAGSNLVVLLKRLLCAFFKLSRRGHLITIMVLSRPSQSCCKAKRLTANFMTNFNSRFKVKERYDSTKKF